MTIEEQDAVASAFMIKAGDALENLGKAALMIAESINAVAAASIEQAKNERRGPREE